MIHSVSITSDNHYIVLSSRDNTAMVWKNKNRDLTVAF